MVQNFIFYQVSGIYATGKGLRKPQPNPCAAAALLEA